MNYVRPLLLLLIFQSQHTNISYFPIFCIHFFSLSAGIFFPSIIITSNPPFIRNIPLYSSVKSKEHRSKTLKDQIGVLALTFTGCVTLRMFFQSLEAQIPHLKIEIIIFYLPPAMGHFKD